MLTPLDIENKKFSRQMMNGYSVEEVDDFLDDLTLDYEKMYKENVEYKNKVDEMSVDVNQYKNIEDTLQNTLIMAQKTADEVKIMAKQQAEQIVREAEMNAKEAVEALNTQIIMKTKELEEITKQMDVYKAKMESILISQLELLKETNRD